MKTTYRFRVNGRIVGWDPVVPGAGARGQAGRPGLTWIKPLCRLAPLGPEAPGKPASGSRLNSGNLMPVFCAYLQLHQETCP